MASVTVYSSDKVDTLIAPTVVGVNLANSRLGLTLQDESTVDVGPLITSLPAASTTVEGVVELATDTETIAGTDTTRAVTPFGLNALTASTTRKGIVELATDAETATGTDTTRAVTPANITSLGIGTRLTALEGIQVSRLTASSFTQTTAYSSYPAGESLMFLTASEATSGSWSFAGKDGLITTYRNGTNIAQRWQRFGGNTAGSPELWARNGNASGWTAWAIILDDDKLPDPQVTSSNTSLGVTATSWANHVATGLTALSLNLSRDSIITVELNAWLTITFTDASSLRVGVSLDGGAPESLFGGQFGQVLYEPTKGSGVGSGQHSMTATAKLSAGSHSFTVQAMKTGGGTATLGYPVLRLTAHRWAE